MLLQFFRRLLQLERNVTYTFHPAKKLVSTCVHPTLLSVKTCTTSRHSSFIIEKNLNRPKTKPKVANITTSPLYHRMSFTAPEIYGVRVVESLLCVSGVILWQTNESNRKPYPFNFENFSHTNKCSSF